MSSILKSQKPHLSFCHFDWSEAYTQQNLKNDKIVYNTVVNCNVQSVKLFLCLFCFRKSGNSELQPWNPYLKAKEPKIEKQSFIV